MASLCAKSGSCVTFLGCQVSADREFSRKEAACREGRALLPLLARQNIGRELRMGQAVILPGKSSLGQRRVMLRGSGVSCRASSGIFDMTAGHAVGEEGRSEAEDGMVALGRRAALVGLLSAVALTQALLVGDARAGNIPEPGFKRHIDRLDGYSIDLPQNWVEVRGAGADVFYRNPAVLDESLFVSISSPSSSNFQGVSDLGSPEDAGEKVVQQYLTEFMSTRIGVRRESQLVNTGSRTGEDGREYYDVELNVKSFSTTNQLAVMPQERPQYMEFDRHYLATLGVENSRLYELRIQTPERLAAQRAGLLKQILQSLRLEKIEAPAAS